MKNSLKILIISLFIFFIIFMFIITRGSFSASHVQVSVSLRDQIKHDIDDYYTSIKNHKMKVSLTEEEINSKVNMIKQIFRQYDDADKPSSVKAKTVNELEQITNMGTISGYLKQVFTDGGSERNILLGYIYMKRTTDSLFKEGTQNDNNISVTDDNNNILYYNFELVKEPPDDFNTQYIDSSRDVKEHVENLIFLYSVTGDRKYLEAIKLEILSAVNWANDWQARYIIDLAEISYAVSLGYDFVYDELTKDERCQIENKLLTSVLLYCIGRYSNNLYDGGNFNQVGNSGIGVTALTLINSSDEGRIKVNEINERKKEITIAYPSKRIVNGELLIEDEYNLLRINENNYIAKIVDEDMYDLLIDMIDEDSEGKYISLRSLYSAVITRTIKNITKVIRSDNSYIDGSYPEGKAYYLYGMRYFSYYLSTLHNVLHSDYTMLDFEDNKEKSETVFNNIVLNPIYIANANGNNLAYGDAGNDATDAEDTIFYLANLNAEKNGESEIANVIYDYRKRTKSIWRFYSIMWYDEEYDAKNNNIDYDQIFRDNIYNNNIVKENINRLGVSAFRNSFTDPNGTFVAMRGGDTKAHHTHLDLGGFAYDALGTRWILDPGSGPYGSKGYHNKEHYRWQYYAARAEAHSTIVINKPSIIDIGTEYKFLASDQWINAYGEFTKFSSSNNSNIATIDLTEAYNKVDNDETVNIQTNSNTVNRGIKLFNSKKYMLVQDEVSLVNVTDYYSFLNINNNKNSNGEFLIDVDILSNEKEAILTDNNNNKVKLYLISNNSDVKFKMIDDITEGTGLLNDFINHPENNSLVNLEVNNKFINHNKLVIYLHNQQPTNVNMQVGVLFVPQYDENASPLPEMLNLTNLADWYIPEKPEIKIMNDNNIVNNNATIKGSALITINYKGTKKANEIIKYSLDSGKNWYIYDDNDSEDLARRTISEAGSHEVNVLALVDDGTGVQSDTTEISNLSFNILKEDVLIFKNLTIDEELKIISRISSNKKMGLFLKNITTNGTITIRRKDGTELSNDDILRTGDIMTIELSESSISYTISILGDVNGDGKATIKDVNEMAKHIIDGNIITGDEYIKAADLNNDSQIKINDLLLLMKSLAN